MSTSTSLLQDVLRPHALGVEKLSSKLAAASLRSSSPTNLSDSDDELVGVVSITRLYMDFIANMIARLQFLGLRHALKHRLARSLGPLRRLAPVLASGVSRALSTLCRKARPKTPCVPSQLKFRSVYSECWKSKI